MSIDPRLALGAEMPAQRFTWTAGDVQTYHLALGAGSNPLDMQELRYLDDAKPQVLPTFGVVAATFHATEAPRVSFPGIDIDLAKVVHGSQEIEVTAPIPASGEAETLTRITEIWDKGTAAVIVQEAVTSAPDGTQLWRTRSSIFAKGEGGFGGERGPKNRFTLPERPADAETRIETLPQQALMYQMCGDRNPLHSDPEFARAAGFPKPILHGRCTYSMVAKAVTDTVLGGDADSLRSIGGRFAGVVYPGDILVCRIWHENDRYLVGVSTADRDEAPVLADVVATTF